LLLGWPVLRKIPRDADSHIAVIMILDMGALLSHRTPIF
jgi:hypothetical protein